MSCVVYVFLLFLQGICILDRSTVKAIFGEKALTTENLTEAWNQYHDGAGLSSEAPVHYHWKVYKKKGC